MRVIHYVESKSRNDSEELDRDREGLLETAPTAGRTHRDRPTTLLGQGQ